MRSAAALGGGAVGEVPGPPAAHPTVGAAAVITCCNNTFGPVMAAQHAADTAPESLRSARGRAAGTPMYPDSGGRSLARPSHAPEAPPPRVDDR